MMLDVLVYLFVFLIVYVAFTLSAYYVYKEFSDHETHHFNSLSETFKLYFWAMLRTGNPHYADVYHVSNIHFARIVYCNSIKTSFNFLK